MDMKYGVIVVAFALIVAIVLLLFIKIEPADAGVSPAETKTYEEVSCPEQAQLIIKDNGLTKIHSCTAEELKLGYETAHIVRILYGQMDCDNGCVYQSYNAIFYSDSTYRQITDSSFAYPEISRHIWNTAKVPIHDAEGISSKELTYYRGGLAIKYSFSKYIRGELYVVENQQIQGHITPVGMSLEQAENMALQELRKQGKLMHYGYKLEHYMHPEKDCWDFLITPDSPGPAECRVAVCLDGEIIAGC